MYKSTIRVRDDPKWSVVFRSSLMSLQLRKHLPEGHQQMMIKVEDKSIIMNYGMEMMRKMVPIHGEEVLRIPEECVTMHPCQKTVLHMELDWGKSSEWPFIALATTSTAVVPFEEPRSEGFMPGLVTIIPRGFITASLREELDKEVDTHYKKGEYTKTQNNSD
jgi:hypothetical protein